MGGRGAGYSLTGGGEVSAATQKSEAKLARLEAELKKRMDDDWNETRGRMGQGWHMSESSDKKRMERRQDKIQSLQKEIARQRQVVARQMARDKARGSLFDYKGNLNITEKNLKQVKAFLRDIDSGKVKSGRTKATVKAWKKKVASLEKTLKTQKKVKIKPSAQRLIDSGKVKQWAKHPDTYFIKGEKTALVLKPDGTFGHSTRYTGPLTEAHRARVRRFIQTGEW